MEQGNPQDVERSIAGYITSIVGAAVALWVINALPGWELRFLGDDYPAVLWAANLSLLTQIGGRLALIFYHPRVLHNLAQVLFDALSLLALVIILSVFPFDFAAVSIPWMAALLRVGLVIGIVASVVSAVVHLIRAVGNIVNRDEDPE